MVSADATADPADISVEADRRRRVLVALDTLPPAQKAMVEQHTASVAEAVLATKVAWSDDDQPVTCKLDGEDASLRVERA